MGSLWVVVGRCGIVEGRCGSLWVVPGFSNYGAGRQLSMFSLVYHLVA